MIAIFKKNKKSLGQLKNKLFPVVIAISVLIVSVTMIVANFRLNQRKEQLLERFEYLKKEIEIAEQKNEELTQQGIQGAQEDFIEKEARERLNLQKPGEKVVVVLPPENAVEKQEQKNWWKKILEFFKF